MTEHTPLWPLVIKVEGDKELLLLSDADDAGTLDLPMHLSYTLVDAGGQLWLRDDEGCLHKADGELPLDTLLGWLQEHSQSEGNCCVAKLYAPDFAAAINMAQELILD